MWAFIFIIIMRPSIYNYYEEYIIYNYYKGGLLFIIIMRFINYL